MKKPHIFHHALVNPRMTDIPNNGIDEDCNGSDRVSTALHEIGENSIVVYPNPTQKDFFVKQVKNRPLKLTLFDVTGKLIIQKESSSELERIDILNQPAGLYILEILDIPSGSQIMEKIKKG